MEEAAVAEVTATRPGLGQVMEDPAVSRAAVVGVTTKEMVAAAIAEPALGASAHRAYIKMPLRNVARISVLSFPVSSNKSDGEQQLSRAFKSAMSDILMRHDDRCTKGLRSPTRVTGLNLPLHKASIRAMTPDTSTTARMATLTDYLFGLVSRAMDPRVSASKAFTFLLRLLTTYFDRTDTGEGYPKKINFGVCKWHAFSIFQSGVSRATMAGPPPPSPLRYVLLFLA